MTEVEEETLGQWVLLEPAEVAGRLRLLTLEAPDSLLLAAAVPEVETMCGTTPTRNLGWGLTNLPVPRADPLDCGLTVMVAVAAAAAAETEVDIGETYAA